MNIHMAAFVFGCLLLFVAILGGGFEVKELKVPKVGRASRLASCVLGILFVVIGFSPAFAGVLPGIPAEPQPQTTTPLAQAATQTTVVATESRSADPATQAPAPDLRLTTGSAQQPPVSKPATTLEPEKPSLKEKAQKKAKKVWHRVW